MKPFLAPGSRSSALAAPHAAPRFAAPRRAPAGQEVSACVLLAGGLRPSPLAGAIGISVLDLRLTPARSVLACWLERIAGLAPRPAPTVRIVARAGVPSPRPPAGEDTGVTVEPEAQQYRGTAGVAYDICAGAAPDDLILLAEGARYFAADPAVILADHAASGADITVARNPDGSPAGLYLFRRETLDLVPRRGFMDLKEQWLRRAMEHGLLVRVAPLRPGEYSFPLRTRVQFLHAAFAAGEGVGRGRRIDPRARAAALADRAVVCPGAAVAPDAVVLDSLVMPGAAVGAGAVVVRSLVLPGARVAPGAELVDRIATRGGIAADPVATP